MCVFLLQEEDEKERISQAKDVNESEGTEHAEAAEDSLLGLSVDEVGLYIISSVIISDFYSQLYNDYIVMKMYRLKMYTYCLF